MTMEYVVPQPMPRMVDFGALPSKEAMAIARRNEPCRTCDGDGTVTETKRADVRQHGRRVGTLPPNFDPSAIKSTSFFYDPRPGDFRREEDHWIAARNLGPGDLEAVPGFIWDRTEEGGR
jgi:hypothetical protein